MAKVSDIPEIKQLLQPLEESGTLIRRTEEEVTPDACHYSDLYSQFLFYLCWLMLFFTIIFHCLTCSS